MQCPTRSPCPAPESGAKFRQPDILNRFKYQPSPRVGSLPFAQPGRGQQPTCRIRSPPHVRTSWPHSGGSSDGGGRPDRGRVRELELVDSCGIRRRRQPGVRLGQADLRHVVGLCQPGPDQGLPGEVPPRPGRPPVHGHRRLPAEAAGRGVRRPAARRVRRTGQHPGRPAKAGQLTTSRTRVAEALRRHGRPGRTPSTRCCSGRTPTWRPGAGRPDLRRAVQRDQHRQRLQQGHLRQGRHHAADDLLPAPLQLHG